MLLSSFVVRFVSLLEKKLPQGYFIAAPAGPPACNSQTRKSLRDEEYTCGWHGRPSKIMYPSWVDFLKGPGRQGQSQDKQGTLA